MSGERLDKALTRRGLSSSRSRAAQLIGASKVLVNGVVITKASTLISAEDHLELSEAASPWVSRAAYKLLGALKDFPQVTVSGAHCLDAGASTGGFTQVLLEAGAADVTAVDVGTAQLVEPLRADPRVSVYEGLNLRYVQPGDLSDPFDLIVADLSFISLTKVMAALAGLAAPTADLLVLVKPQFEVGREHLGRTGVVSSEQLRERAVHTVIDSAQQHGLRSQGQITSALPGQDGNIEYFLHLVPATESSGAGADRGDVVQNQPAAPLGKSPHGAQSQR